MHPSELRSLLRRVAASAIRAPHSPEQEADALAVVGFADSFDQPGDGPLAYSESEGRMVRLERVPGYAIVGDDRSKLWRFPGALEAE